MHFLKVKHLKKSCHLSTLFVSNTLVHWSNVVISSVSIIRNNLTRVFLNADFVFFFLKKKRRIKKFNIYIPYPSFLAAGISYQPWTSEWTSYQPWTSEWTSLTTVTDTCIFSVSMDLVVRWSVVHRFFLFTAFNQIIIEILSTRKKTDDI